MQRIINLLLKMLSLSSKFAFIVLAGKVISETDFGYYALFSSFIVYISGFIGLEYHSYNNRMMISSKSSEQKILFSNQLAFITIVIVFCAPISLLLYFFDALPWSLTVWFFLILVFEYTSLEIVRLLNILDEQIKSTIIYSIKTSCWMIPLTVVWFFKDNAEIYSVYFLWLFFSILSTLVGVFFLRRKIIEDFKLSNVYFNKIISVVSKSKVIFISSQLALIVFVLDRYLLKLYSGVELVSVYFFYFMITNSLLAVLESSVFVFYVPSLIRSINKKDEKLIFSLIKDMRNMAFVVVFLCAAIMMVSIDLVIKYVGKELFFNYKSIFYILLFSVVLRVLSLVYHYAIYSLKLDKELAYINLCSLILFVITFFSLNFFEVESIYSLSISMVIISLFHLLIKFIVVRVKLKLI